jgi:hypothetical protein
MVPAPLLAGVQPHLQQVTHVTALGSCGSRVAS